MAHKSLFLRFTESWVARQWDKLLLLGLISLFFVLVPSQPLRNAEYAQSVSSVLALPFATPTPAPYPVNLSGYYPAGEVSAQGVVVYDIASGVTLYGRNPTQLLSPASTTKILTALVALGTYELDDIITVQTVANDGQVMGLVPGERITVENLLYGTLVNSGNDAAWALAEAYPGGVEGFVQAMNDTAEDLFLTDSHFTNPVGYDDPVHKMTAIDLVRLASHALTIKTIAKMVAIPQITVSDTTFTHFHPLTNINQLVGRIPGVGGIKTGWTEEAGENLVTLVDRNGHKTIIVVLKSQDRFSDTVVLIDWVFANFEWRDLASEVINSDQ